MVDYHHNEEEMVLEKVQLTDLDNAAYLPHSRYIKGIVAGNKNWRSPEAFFKSKLSKPADIFSFGIIVNAGIHVIILFINPSSVSMPFLVG
jgi:serine/threonine protein kinase